MYSTTTPNGKLQDKFLPAVYFDSSVIIDYWMTEGMEVTTPDDDLFGGQNWPDRIYGHELSKLVRDLLKSDIRISKVLELRKKLLAYGEDVKVLPVTSEPALWELQEWIAESGFKQLGAEISGTVFLQKKSKKEIGDLLKKAYELWMAEGHEKHHDPKTGTSALESLVQSTWINLSFAHSHGLNGILVAEINNFCWPPKRSRNRKSFPDPFSLAYLQLGTADIFHILLAHHLGCQYFASFDSDFRRAKDFITQVGMTLLTTPEEILSIM